jgi:hypothetical protein
MGPRPPWASRPQNFGGSVEHLRPKQNSIFLEHRSSHVLQSGDARANPFGNTRSHKVCSSVSPFLGSYENARTRENFMREYTTSRRTNNN